MTQFRASIASCELAIESFCTKIQFARFKLFLLDTYMTRISTVSFAHQTARIGFGRHSFEPCGAVNLSGSDVI